MLSSVGKRAGWSGRREHVASAATPAQVFPLPAGERGAWISRARTVPCFACDAVFAIQTSFYVGPEDGIGSLQWDEANVRLPLVELPRRWISQVSTTELLGQELALAEHYRRIVALARQHGKMRSLRPFPCFRIQPAIFAEDQQLTEFFWRDDLHGTRMVLEAFAEAAAGPPRLIHEDMDQGWGLLMVATGTATGLIDWDAEGPPPEEGGLAFDPAELARQASATLERLSVVHARLVGMVGRDYWT